MNLSKPKENYRIYFVRKSNGKKRKICEPIDDLKRIQKELSLILEKNFPIHKSAYGFVKGKSIVDAASQHTNKDWVVNIDIKDFFPSIKLDFLNFLNSFELKICLLDNSLPQGSPCSPIITNIVMYDCDEKLSKYAENKNYTYTRYADDLTFSGFEYLDIKDLLSFVKDTLSKLNLRINYEKVRFMPKHKRQEVLGIVVNEKVNAKKELRKKIRAIVHQGNLDVKTNGVLSFIKMIDPKIKI